MSITRALAPLLIALCMVSPASADWPGFLGGEERPLSPVQELPAFPRIAWQFPLFTDVTTSPVADGTRLFVGGNNGRLYAIELATGAVAWTFQTGGPIRAAATFVEDDLLVASSDGKVRRLRRADGRLVAALDAGTPLFSSPAASSDTLLVAGSNDMTLRAYDLATFAPRWSAPLDQPTESTPLVMGGRVFLGGNDGALYAFDLATGARLFKFATNGHAGFHSPVPLDSGTVLFAPGALDDRVYAVDAATGTEVWRYTGGVSGVPHAPALPGKRVGLSHLHRMPWLRDALPDLTPGAPPRAPSRAPSRAAAIPPNAYISPFAAGFVYTSSGIARDASRVYLAMGYPSPKLLAIDRTTRALVWSVPLGEFSDPVGFYPAPIVSGGRVYMFDASGFLRVLDSATGAELHMEAGALSCSGTAAATGGRLYSVSKNGFVSAFHAGADPSLPEATPPEVHARTPEPGSTVAALRPLIAAYLQDAGSGLAPSTVVLKLDGADVVFSIDGLSGRVAHTPGADLAPGLHTVFLQAADVMGNPVTSTWSFTVAAVADTEPPVITALSPAPESSAQNPFPELLVSIVDAGGAGVDPASLSIRLDGKGLPHQYDAGAGLLRALPLSPLAPDPHEVRVNASDAAGNAAPERVYSFTVAPPDDAVPPAIEALSPAPGGTVATTRLPVVSVRITDAGSGVRPESCSLIVAGRLVPATFDPTTGGFSGRVEAPLPDGAASAEVYAEDLRGNWARATIPFTVEVKIAIEGVRVANLSESGATVAWTVSPPAASSLEIARTEDFSGPTFASYPASGGLPAELHAVTLPSLAAGEIHYVRLNATPEGGTPLLDPTVYTFVLPASPAAGSVTSVSARIVRDGAAFAGAQAFLTAERSAGGTSLPLYRVSSADGTVAFDLSNLRDRDGATFPLESGDRLRLFARAAGGLQHFAIFAASLAPVQDLGDLSLGAEVAYTYRFVTGIHLVSFPFVSETVGSAYRALETIPGAHEIGRYDRSAGRYESAALAFGAPAGDNFILTPHSGCFLRMGSPGEATVSGALAGTGTVALGTGLNLVRLPGGPDLPDNPLFPQASRAYLAANPALKTLTGFDEGRQFFVSSYIADGAPRGDDFPLLADRSYFVNAAYPATLGAAGRNALAPSPTSAPAPGLAPARAAHRAGSSAQDLKRRPLLALPPHVVAGRALTSALEPLAGVELLVTPLADGLSAEPLRALTDADGRFHVNLGNLRGASAGPLDPSSLLFRVAAPSGDVRTVSGAGRMPLLLEPVILERGEGR